MLGDVRLLLGDLLVRGHFEEVELAVRSQLIAQGYGRSCKSTVEYFDEVGELCFKTFGRIVVVVN